MSNLTYGEWSEWKSRLKYELRYLDLRKQADYDIFLLLSNYLKFRRSKSIIKVFTKEEAQKCYKAMLNSDIEHCFFGIVGVNDKIISINYGEYYNGMRWANTTDIRMSEILNKRVHKIGVYSQTTGFKSGSFRDLINLIPSKYMENMIWDLDKLR
tara:strand:- start:141 stop:605 length:465 start_codon:yes stop_codon:yes gene_type:complete